MTSIVTWVLIADAATARMVSYNARDGEVVELLGKAWQAPSPAEYSDEPGSVHHGVAQDRSAVVRPDPKRIAEHAFAKELAQKMTDYYRKSAFDELVIIAAPHMLGEVRGALGAEVRSVVVTEIAKDLTNVPVRDLPKHLNNLLKG